MPRRRSPEILQHIQELFRQAASAQLCFNGLGHQQDALVFGRASCLLCLAQKLKRGLRVVLALKNAARFQVFACATRRRLSSDTLCVGRRQILCSRGVGRLHHL